ncbi:PREDICTED: uncharacterized protein LOC109216478 [Nicotiana attenuata]|uniref:Calcium-binding protein cml48 n=1 Tax=Nicotiana attenuata TaxID=49451 RepID=A0A1J6KXY1_NICAT|nr:PREDICTED: uncharacterized protein LOC109216478 [Nicotiana attenuata]OIT23897.1 putative calcium-binding protein cml48 [Nicotiana attenuata]
MSSYGNRATYSPSAPPLSDPNEPPVAHPYHPPPSSSSGNYPNYPLSQQPHPQSSGYGYGPPTSSSYGYNHYQQAQPTATSNYAVFFHQGLTHKLFRASRWWTGIKVALLKRRSYKRLFLRVTKDLVLGLFVCSFFSSKMPLTSSHALDQRNLLHYGVVLVNGGYTVQLLSTIGFYLSINSQEIRVSKPLSGKKRYQKWRLT